MKIDREECICNIDIVRLLENCRFEGFSQLSALCPLCLLFFFAYAYSFQEFCLYVFVILCSRTGPLMTVLHHPTRLLMIG